MTEIYNFSAINITNGTSYYASINSMLDYIPSIMFLIIIYVGVLYYSRESGIFKAQIAASGITTGIAIILALSEMLPIEIMFIPIGLLVLGILVSVFVGDN